MTMGENIFPRAEAWGSTATIEMDVLVVGTGPAGASLACFLTQKGERWGNNEIDAWNKIIDHSIQASRV